MLYLYPTESVALHIHMENQPDRGRTIVVEEYTPTCFILIYKPPDNISPFCCGIRNNVVSLTPNIKLKYNDGFYGILFNRVLDDCRLRRYNILVYPCL